MPSSAPSVFLLLSLSAAQRGICMARRSDATDLRCRFGFPQMFITVDETAVMNAGQLHMHRFHWTHHLLERAPTAVPSSLSIVAAPHTESHGDAALSRCISDDVPGARRLYSLSGREYTVTSKRRCAFRLIKTRLPLTNAPFERQGRCRSLLRRRRRPPFTSMLRF